MMFGQFSGENRQLLRETRIVQDLRAASDLIARDLRRAGYWGDASTGVWVTGMTGTPAINGYGKLSGAPCATAALDLSTTTSASSAICYTVASGSGNTVSSADKYGFELDGGVIYAVIGGATRAALTDPKTITITDLVITPSSQTLTAADFCAKTCTSNCPQVVVREFEVLIKGTLPNDSTVSRFLRSNVRVRNDYFSGSCPTS
jgi:type IV pilus assembly protein PilW